MNKQIQRKRNAVQFNNLMNTLIDNDISSKQYDEIIDKLVTQMSNDPSDFVVPNSLEFINNIINVHGEGTNTIELFYPIVLSVLLFYVESVKEVDSYNDTKTPLTAIVVNFAELVGIEIELIGDICSYDSYFKKFLAYENKDVIPEEKSKRVNKEYNLEVAVDLLDW